MDQDTLDKLFSAADTDHNGRIDLREFAYVLAKINPDLPLAEAKDSATDFFVLFKIDPARYATRGIHPVLSAFSACVAYQGYVSMPVCCS